MAAVLDASALLAYLRDEPGAEVVAEAIADGAVVSTVNLAEVFSRTADRGVDPTKLAAQLRESGLLGGALTVEQFTVDDAIEAGRLRPMTRDAGLSLGDRACLALARRLDSPALTADTAWIDAAHGVELLQIR
ncbi:MAG: type II toxin-antitoxin system VapC family toxin [Solirubrobacteraceae bacterium]